MARCPHCGEVVEKDQERCFACGQKVRARVRRGEQPVNPVVFVLAGLLVLAGVIGIILINAGRARQARSLARQEEQARIKDSLRDAVQARRDSAKAVARSSVASVLVDEVNGLEQRFNLVRKQVVKGQPSPAQSELISRIGTELARLRLLTANIGDPPSARGDSIREQVRDGERAVRTLISDLSRAPKR